MKNKPDAATAALAMMLMAAIVAAVTYPLLVYSGAHQFLVELSVYCTREIFRILGLPQ